MKHILFTHRLLVLLLSAFPIISSAINTQTAYYIFHSSGMALSSVDGTPNLHTFDASESQTFQFVQSGNYYLIKNKKTGTNIAKKETWNTEFTSSTGNVAKFSVESSGGDFVKFKCADNNLYLGTDGTAPGSSVYSDKNGKETLHYWYLREANGSQLVTDGLQTIIAKAENRLASTIEGDKEGQFSSATRKKLQDAIDDADITLQNASSQQEIITATQTLNTALTNYNNQRNHAFVTGEKYYIMHASNRYLSNENNNIQIKNRKFNTAQQFVFEAAGNNTYAIKNVASNTYLNASGEYNVNLANSSSNNSARFKIDYAPNEDLYVRFQFASNSKYLGTDGTSDGKGVYSDKDGTDGKHYWHLIRVDGEPEQPYKFFHIGSSALRLGMNWYDEEGNHINAHGGCVIYENGTYYWFGENYRPSPVRSNGIVCYTSKDLYNWKLEGMAYKCPEAALRNDYQDMNYGRTLERPKVMYCPNTGKYVMWVHWENGSGYAASRVAILYSDKITGPYTFLKTMRPRGDEQPSGSRDQTLLFDPDYNAGYHFGSAEENMTMHGTLLTKDYLDLSNTWERIFVQKQYEAPAIFKYHKRFVAITSGCTGWDPNPAHSSYSQLPLSGWNDKGNPCVDKDYNKSYHSQSNYVFKVPNKYDAYIFMGDRWKGGDYFSDANVGESWHIWLPIDMRTGYPIIHFYSEWDLSIFDKINRYRRVDHFEEGKSYLLLSKNANKILSNKDGKILLTEDNDEINLSFHVTTTGNYAILTTAQGEALTAGSDGVFLSDSTGREDQQWKISSSNTNDGYFYFQPRNNSSKALTNFSASPTANGIAGIGNWEKLDACQFAFCFDSKKYNYAPITDESDGSYQRWIESKGYEQTTNSDEIIFSNKEEQEVALLIYEEEGHITLHSLKNQVVTICDMNGRIVQTISMDKDEIRNVTLSQGVYSINGYKWLKK